MGRRELAVEKTEEEKVLEADHSAILSAIASAKQELEQLGRDKAAIVSSISQLESDRKIAAGLNKSIEEDRRTVSNKYFAEKRDFEAFVSEHAEKKASMTASLPDVDVALAELEAMKAPIRSEIDRLSKLQLESQESLKEWQDKVAAAEETHRSLSVDIKASAASLEDLKFKISGARAEINAIGEKKIEYQNIVEGIKVRGEILSDTNKKITDAENSLVAVNADVAAAHDSLLKVKEEKDKIISDADDRMKSLAILEARVDQKIEVFKQYKEKFNVDELSRMKVNTDTP